MDLNPKKENVDQINRKPLAYMLGVCIILLGIFIGRSFFTDNQRQADCKEQIVAITRRAEKSDSDAIAARDELVRYLLYDKERKGRQRQIIDSVVKKAVGNKAKRIINSQNK